MKIGQHILLYIAAVGMFITEGRTVKYRYGNKQKRNGGLIMKKECCFRDVCLCFSYYNSSAREFATKESVREYFQVLLVLRRDDRDHSVYNKSL